jgi:hypothetical protein
LRRLYKKRPYFTNGSAKDLPSVLTRARFGTDQFWHDAESDAPPDDDDDGSAARSRLDNRDSAALLTFLDLL